MLGIDTSGPVTRLRMSRSLGGRPVYWVSAYIVDGLMVDTGLYYTRREVVAEAKLRGVRQVFITHQHEDHTGGAGALHKSLGLIPQAGPLTVPYLVHPPRIHFYRAMVWGNAQPTPASVVSQAQTDHYTFRVLPTPGHSPDHSALYEPRQGWVFSGDLFVHPFVKYFRADESMPDLVVSLRQIAGLGADRLFCAHYGVVTSPAVAIERKLAYWADVQAQCLALHDQGRPEPVIRDTVLGTEGAMTRFSRGHLSKLNLVRALLDAPTSIWSGPLANVSPTVPPSESPPCF